MTKKKLAGKRHEKGPISRAVVLEYRRTIGFSRTPVREEGVVIDGLPTSHWTRYD